MFTTWTASNVSYVTQNLVQATNSTFQQMQDLFVERITNRQEREVYYVHSFGATLVSKQLNALERLEYFFFIKYIDTVKPGLFDSSRGYKLVSDMPGCRINRGKMHVLIYPRGRKIVSDMPGCRINRSRIIQGVLVSCSWLHMEHMNVENMP